MRILYVEDNPANISLLQRIARMGGHDVAAYNDGEVALANFDQDKPDLILMDLQLAGALGGLDVVRKLRADGVTTPIIAVTAYAMVGDKERCMEAGCDGYLAKPLPVAELVETVQKYDEALKAKDSAPASVVDADTIVPVSKTESMRETSEIDRSKVLRETLPLPDLASKAAARKAARERKEQAAAAKAVTLVANKKNDSAKSGTETKPETKNDETPTQPAQRIAGIHPLLPETSNPESTQEMTASSNGGTAAVAASEGLSENGKKD
jgi:CheY-like chemotaxis protein